jgi:hypothetical protein
MHEDILDILQEYAAGRISVLNAAYEIQMRKLPGRDFPSPFEVIIWSREAGLGIPTPTDEEAASEAAAILARYHRNEDGDK